MKISIEDIDLYSMNRSCLVEKIRMEYIPDEDIFCGALEGSLDLVYANLDDMGCLSMELGKSYSGKSNNEIRLIIFNEIKLICEKFRIILLEFI